MRRLASIFLMASFVTACAGTAQPEFTSVQLPPNVDVIFSALLPENTPSGETIIFTILDEVTGLEFNQRHEAMQVSGQHSVSVTISVPAGTLLKYRYARQTASDNAGETSINGESISYRAYLVDGPGHIAHDVVAAWADAPATTESGQISGTVTDATSGRPVADLIAVAAGEQSRTDLDGRFVIAGLPQGLHNVLVYSPSGHYGTFQQGALVAANNETPANISLTASPTAKVTFWMTPPEEHTANTPVFLAGNLDAFAMRPLASVQEDGRYSVSMQLPTGIDIRYKYTLGDGFWNAEHVADGSFAVRQLVIPQGTTSLEIEDNVASWTAGFSAPIWFELTAPADSVLAYVQFNLGEWTTPLPMWPLGEGHWAYKLYSPTNFASPVEYRYCLDSACTILEASPGQPRTFLGNQPALQQIQDHIDAW
ncbi:MAG: hypothetical protein WEA61_08280 [Anaerolineales bacterium]